MTERVIERLEDIEDRICETHEAILQFRQLAVELQRLLGLPYLPPVCDQAVASLDSINGAYSSLKAVIAELKADG